MLTFGADIQKDRIEVYVYGWGMGYENWLIDHYILWGSAPFDEPLKQLDNLLNKPYMNESGHWMTIEAGFIDSGYQTQFVYEWADKYNQRNVFASKGRAGQIPLVSAPSQKKRGKLYRRPHVFYTIGVDEGKAVILSQLRIEEQGAGYCHLPVETEDGREICNKVYINQLLAEELKMDERTGKLKWVNTAHDKRNEALDCKVLAFAALRLKEPIAWYDRKRKYNTPKEVIVVEDKKEPATPTKRVKRPVRIKQNNIWE